MILNISKKHLLFLIAGLLLSIFVVQAYAQIIVSELQPFKLGRWTMGSGDIAANQNICIAMLPQGPYQVSVGGDIQSGAFVLKSGFDSIPYRLFFNDRPRLNGRSEMTPGVTLTGLRGKRLKKREPCNKPTANISILIPEINLIAAPSGQYSSNIEILVSPE